MKLDTVTVAITLDNGELAVMGFLVTGRGNSLPSGAFWLSDGIWRRPPNEANIRAEVLKTFDDTGSVGRRPQPVRWRIVKEADVPTDRTYRAAWMDNGRAIVHDVEKVKGIVLERVRSARAKAFQELDARWMRAVGQGNTTQAAAVEAERQALRDKPAVLASAFQKAKTVQAVHALLSES